MTTLLVDVQGSIFKSLSISHDVTNDVTTWMVDVQVSILKSLSISHDVTKWMVDTSIHFKVFKSIP